eukprot:scaffold36139_cov112-Isochrysis_galbana.AAC.2
MIDALKPARIDPTAGAAACSYTCSCPSVGENAASNVNEYAGAGPSPSSCRAVTMLPSQMRASPASPRRSPTKLGRTRTTTRKSADANGPIPAL